MQKLFRLSIFIVLAFYSCTSNTSSLTIKQFTRAYSDSLKIRFPTAVFSIVDDSTISSNYQENDVRISVDNAYRDYMSEPESISAILSKYVTVSSELFSSKSKINLNKIVPIIKPIAYIEDVKNAAKNLGGGEGVTAIYEKYNDQLIIAYAEDTQNSIRYLTNDDLKELAVTIDSLRTVAKSNLETLLTDIRRQGGNGTFMMTAGGNYETSLILFQSIFNKESLPVNGDFVIAIPNRDMLLITGSNDLAGISKIRQIAQKSFQTGAYQVSEYLYKWNGKTFEKLD